MLSFDTNNMVICGVFSFILQVVFAMFSRMIFQAVSGLASSHCFKDKVNLYTIATFSCVLSSCAVSDAFDGNNHLRLLRFLTFIPELTKLDHLHHAKSDDSSLCVVTKTQSIHKSSTSGNNILQNKDEQFRIKNHIAALQSYHTTNETAGGHHSYEQFNAV